MGAARKNNFQFYHNQKLLVWDSTNCTKSVNTTVKFRPYMQIHSIA